MNKRMGREMDIKTIRDAARSWVIDDKLIGKAIARNGWFTEEGIKTAVGHWQRILNTDDLNRLAQDYPSPDDYDVTVGIVMAGNIPLVGLHDLICVLLAGYKVRYKPSSDDEVLMDHVIESMYRLDPGLKDRIVKAERLKGIDMVIATGSNNTSRYFDYYFRDIPRLIRKNKTSVAILTGEETDEDLQSLASDIFSYFGKGCRNVSYVFLPDDETLQKMLKSIDEYGHVMDHHKYANNYTYHKAIWLMNKEPFFDTGNLCVKESKSLHSPLGTLYFKKYTSLDEVASVIGSQKEDIQSVVGSVPGMCDTPFGQSQFPPLDWFADNVNTMEFLTKHTHKAS